MAPNDDLAPLLARALQEPGRAPGPGGFRPARDARAEAQAHSVAASVGAPAAGGSQVVDGRLSGGLQDALAPALGDTSHLKVHSDGLAAALSASIGARAFTAGQDIYLGSGELARPSDARELLAHEAAHAALHPTGVAADGTVLVHAWLKGTRAAVEKLGGGKTSGKIASLANVKTNWDLILEGLKRYEKAEDAARAKPMSPLNKVKVAGKLLALVKTIQSAVDEWEKANADPADQDVIKAAVAQNKAGNWDSPTASDTRTKAGRRQAITMLRPRLAMEIKNLTSGEWASQVQMADENRTGGKDAAEKGGVNEVDKIIYGAGADSFTGYFKADVGFALKLQSHEARSGIRQHDPNYGARSVAMSRLDTLLGTNVIAKTAFATHGGQLGTVMEEAKGRSMGTKGGVSIIKNEAQRGTDTTAVALDDPVLQSCLNKLQIIDAIAGQLDRHGDNYYVQQDAQGKVTGVTGIDLDMAFGAEMKDMEARRKWQAFNFLGMAKLVDAELGDRILKITDEQIRAALGGLLTPAEVEATVARFDLVRQHVQQVAASGGGLTRAWTPATAQAGMAAGFDPFNQQTPGAREYAYRVEWSADDAHKVVKASLAALPALPKNPAFKPDPSQWARLAAAPAPVQVAFQTSEPLEALKAPMWAGQLAPSQALEGAAELVAEVIRNDLADIAQFAQANPTLTDALKRTAKVNAAYKARAAKAASWVSTSASLPQLPALPPLPAQRGTRPLKRRHVHKQLANKG